jgi:hypothetical protein
MAHNLRDQLTDDHKSKDGLSASLFPLTSREQARYNFELKKEEIYKGTPVYRISFRPRKPDKTGDSEGALWSGEVLIDKKELQPISIATNLAHGVPFLARTAMGTDLHGLGFAVNYQKFDDRVWFPVSYGTEFNVRILFVYSRKVAVSLANSDFKRVETGSSIVFGPTKQ